MGQIEEMEEYIKENWFGNHEATITKHDGIVILDWRKPGTVLYSVRYIFAGAKMYISGDIGDAIFDLTWKATPESFNDVNLGYLLGKLSCHSRDRWHFDEPLANEELGEWFGELILDADQQYLNELKEVRECVSDIFKGVISSKELEMELHNYYMNKSFSYVYDEDFSMISRFGRKLPKVFVAYLLGIKMANEQLKEAA